MTITITLKGADARFSASIAQLLKLKTKDQFTLSEHGDITLVDADSIEGRKFVENNLNNHTILLTVSPSQFKHNLIVRKPVKIDELLSVLNSIDISAQKVNTVAKDDHEVEAVPTSGNPFAKFSDPEYLKSLKSQKQYNLNTKDEIKQEAVSIAISEEEKTFKYWKSEFEKNTKLERYRYDEHFFEEMEKLQIVERSDIYFQSEDIYCDLSQKATLYIFEQVYNKKLTLDIYYFYLGKGIVFLFPDDIVVSNLTLKKDGNFFEVESNDIKLQKIISHNELLELIHKFDTYYYHEDILNILSRLVLLEAKGRIINRKDIEAPLGLLKKKQAPAHFMHIPYSEEIDSIWEFRNISLRETLELLPEISPYYIFSYYTLCELYGLFDGSSGNKKAKKHLDLNELILELQKL